MPPPSPSSVRRRALLLAAGAAGSLASPWPLRAATLPRVLLFSPNSEGNTYWPQVFEILSNVAQALQFDFVPFSFGVGDRFVRQAEALRLIGQAPRPQAVIADVVIGDAARELEAAEQAGVPLFLLGPLFPAELPALGGAPRLKYRRWAALLQSDEEEKGYRLGGLLLDAARQAQAFARDGRVHAVGLGGARSWSGSQLREAGFARAVTERPFALLHQVVPTRWSPAEGRHITTRLLQRYPESSVVWAASDQLGAGAAQALQEAGRTLGRDAFTGGLDLSELGLALVQQGRFVATVAASFASWFELAVLVNDHVRGVDFADELGSAVSFPTLTATRENAAQIQEVVRLLPSIDPRPFSKAATPARRRYDFSQQAFASAVAGLRRRGPP